MRSASDCRSRVFILAAAAMLLVGCGAPTAKPLRIASFNIEDVRSTDLARPDHPRLAALGLVIRDLAPDVVLLNELSTDDPGSPTGQSDANAQAFVDRYVHAPGGKRYRLFVAPSNTGIHSGFDLNRDGSIRPIHPPIDPPRADGSQARQTPDGRAYGNDARGFGTFPGQYAMALLVAEPLRIDQERARTFMSFRWTDLPGHRMPTLPETDEPWYQGDAGESFRLSSKSHWDVPIIAPGGARFRVLCSHPTPPAFDGPERRNMLRNHDEIRFWGAYLGGSDAIYDDAGTRGGIEPGVPFVILGDLNADPDEGRAFDDPVGTWLFSHPRVNGAVTPRSPIPVDGLDDDDTARFRMRVDYAQPSVEWDVLDAGVVREVPAGLPRFPSDHFPVWIDVILAGPGGP